MSECLMHRQNYTKALYYEHLRKIVVGGLEEYTWCIPDCGLEDPNAILWASVVPLKMLFSER